MNNIVLCVIFSYFEVIFSPSAGSDSDSEYDDEEPTPQRPQQISRPPRATSSRPLSTRAKTPAQRIRSAVRSQANPAANSLDASLIHRTLSVSILF